MGKTKSKAELEREEEEAQREKLARADQKRLEEAAAAKEQEREEIREAHASAYSVPEEAPLPVVTDEPEPPGDRSAPEAPAAQEAPSAAYGAAPEEDTRSDEEKGITPAQAPELELQHPDPEPDFTITQGQAKGIEVHGYHGGKDLGILKEAIIMGSDNHTLQVNSFEDGTGTVAAVGPAGSSAAVIVNVGGLQVKLGGKIDPRPQLDEIRVKIVDLNPAE